MPSCGLATVVPIHPRETAIEGAARIARCSMFLAPSTWRPSMCRRIGERIIDDVARKGIGEVWLNPGAE